MTTAHRTTVAIPLHASALWFEVVAANLDRLAGHAHLVVSDPTGLDDTLDRLRAGREHVAGIEWRTTATARGWVAHCNALLAEATTEFFMWLPHDDDIGPEWIHEAEAALDADSSAILAVGHAEAVGDRGSLGPLEIDPRTRHPDVEYRLGAVADVWVNGDLRSLGVAFRGVFRRAGAPLLPQLDGGGSSADLLWAGALMRDGRLTSTDARYIKRYHDANTHQSWDLLPTEGRLRPQLLPDLLENLPTAIALQILGTVWERERIRWGEVAEAATASAAQREAAIGDAYASSRSWRATRPFRALRERVSRLRRPRGMA